MRSESSSSRVDGPEYAASLIEGLHLWDIMEDPNVQVDWFRRVKEIRAHCARHRLHLDNYQTKGIQELYNALGLNVYSDTILERLAPSIKSAVRKQLIFLARKTIIVNFKKPDGSWAAVWPPYTNEWLGPDWSGSLEPATANETHHVHHQALTPQPYPEDLHARSRHALRASRTRAGTPAGATSPATAAPPPRSVPNYLGADAVSQLTPQLLDLEDPIPQTSHQLRAWERLPTFIFSSPSPQAPPQQLPPTCNLPSVVKRHGNSVEVGAAEQPAALGTQIPQPNRVSQPEPPSHFTDNTSEATNNPVQPLDAVSRHLRRRSSISLPGSPPRPFGSSRFGNGSSQGTPPQGYYPPEKAEAGLPDLLRVSTACTANADVRTRILALEQMQRECRIQGWPDSKTERIQALEGRIASSQTLLRLRLEEITNNHNAFMARVNARVD